MATLAPALARARAMPRPIRSAPPVTNADLPLRVRMGMQGLFTLLGLRLARVRLLCRVRGLIGFWGGIGGLVVLLVDGVLLSGPPHPDFDGKLILVHLEILAMGLEALGDHLHRSPVSAF